MYPESRILSENLSMNKDLEHLFDTIDLANNNEEVDEYKQKYLDKNNCKTNSKNTLGLAMGDPCRLVMDVKTTQSSKKNTYEYLKCSHQPSL